MTREEKIAELINIRDNFNYTLAPREVFDDAIKALEQEPCRDAVSKSEVIKAIDEREDANGKVDAESVRTDIVLMPPVTPQPKTGHCRDCKWWKDSDGVYRRGIGAESQCPINRREVFEGNGYCYMFAPQESEDKK